MRLVILDPNLVDTHGHHALYDRVLGAEARARNCEVVILGNRRFGQDRLDDIPVHPLLDTTCYAQFSQDPVFGPHDDVELGNRAVFDELSALPQDFFRRSDLVLVHTVSHITLMGLITWVAALPAARCPHFAICLMLPSGIGFDADGAMLLDDAATATGYREAFRRAARANLDVTFLASGAQHARQFSALAGQDIASHALLTGFDEHPSRAAMRPNQVLLFAGDAKMNKGLGLLPDLVAALCPAHPGHDFIIHANPEPAWGAALEVVETLRRLAPQHPNLRLSLSPLSSPDYADLLSASGIVLFPYDPDEYRRKSSGVVWEAIASCSQLVVPQDTWLDAECAHWGAAFEAYEPGQAARALDRIIAGYDRARSRADRAGARFDAANGVKTLFDQLADPWVARAASLGPDDSQSHTVKADAFGNQGWHILEQADGIPVRWSDRAASLHQVLPGLGGWTLTLAGPFAFSAAQIQGARLMVDGVAQTTRFGLAEDGAWSLSCQFEETRADMPLRTVSLHLDWTQTNDGDGRELGLLTGDLTIAEAAPQEAWIPTALIAGAGQGPPDRAGWSAPLTSGSWHASLPPGQDCVIGFRVEGTAAPQEVAQLQIFANGQVVIPRLHRDSDWQVQVCLPGAATLGHAQLVLDIVLATPARVQMQSLLWTRGRRSAVPQDAAAQPELQPELRPESRPEPETRPKPAAPVTAPVTAPITTPMPAQAPQAANASWSCDRVENFGALSFINPRITGFTLGQRVLGDFHIKIMRTEASVALELRERDGAFQLLHRPDPDMVHSDEWGEVITLFADHDGACTGAAPGAVAQNADALLALLAQMPDGLAGVDLPRGELADWQAAARTLTRALSAA